MVGPLGTELALRARRGDEPRPVLLDETVDHGRRQLAVAREIITDSGEDVFVSRQEHVM